MMVYSRTITQRRPSTPLNYPKETRKFCSRAPRRLDRCCQIQEERKLASGQFMIISAQMGRRVSACKINYRVPH